MHVLNALRAGLRLASLGSRWGTGPLLHRALSSKSRDHYEVVIAGGAVMGCSSAYFLANRIPGDSICIIERDTLVIIIVILIPPIVGNFTLCLIMPEGSNTVESSTDTLFSEITLLKSEIVYFGASHTQFFD